MGSTERSHKLWSFFLCNRSLMQKSLLVSHRSKYFFTMEARRRKNQIALRPALILFLDEVSSIFSLVSRVNVSQIAAFFVSLLQYLCVSWVTLGDIEYWWHWILTSKVAKYHFWNCGVLCYWSYSQVTAGWTFTVVLLWVGKWVGLLLWCYCGLDCILGVRFR